MEKIKTITYLYKEVLENFKQDIIDICILDQFGNRSSLAEEYSLFFVCPELTENVVMYKKIISINALYITYGNFSKTKMNKNYYTNILNIGNKYKIYIALKNKVNKDELKYICLYIAIVLSDIIIINKISNIEDGIRQLDIALDLGKDIYAIPGDIFEYKNYLANFAIKQGATPICSIYDMKNILGENRCNVL